MRKILIFWSKLCHYICHRTTWSKFLAHTQWLNVGSSLNFNFKRLTQLSLKREFQSRKKILILINVFLNKSCKNFQIYINLCLIQEKQQQYNCISQTIVIKQNWFKNAFHIKFDTLNFLNLFFEMNEYDFFMQIIHEIRNSFNGLQKFRNKTLNNEAFAISLYRI